MSRKTVTKFRILVIIALAMIVVQLLNAMTGNSLNHFGLLPRSASGPINILFMPWIHGSWQHLFSNLPPFLVLSALIIHQSKRYYILSSLIIIVVSGLLVWLFGRPAYHIGASGWVFGLWSLLVTNAFKRRRLSDIIIGIAVIFYYGMSMLMGILPLDSRISIEGHLAGAIGGFCAAVLLQRISRSKNPSR